MRLENKIAVITGGTSGMGRAASELFAKEGAKVVIGARREHLGKYVAESIRSDGGNAIFVKADVSEKHEVMNLIDEATNAFGGLDILFNNAGINNHGDGEPHNEDLENFDQVMNVNLKGAFLCIRYAVPRMIEGNGGSIINNSSVLDLRATETSSTSYHLSKGGMSILTKKAALSYAKYNIRVNSIQPGAIATEMSNVSWDDLETSAVIEHRRKFQPLERMGHPIDVAYAALYFASDESAFVTGASLLVDGGSSASFGRNR